MIQQQKEKLEQAAQKWYGNAPGTLSKNIFKHGAQTILDNPSEFGLATKEDVMSKIRLLHEAENRWGSKVKDLESQLTKYRELLGRLKELHSDHELTCVLIEEALKNNEG